jgi:hypothetical protein
MTIISDFDGLVTDLEAEAVHYFEYFAQDLACQLGLPEHFVSGLLAKEKDIVAVNPGMYGWTEKGIITAPATSDPYVHIGVAAQLMLQKLKAAEFKLLPTEDTWDDILHHVFSRCYPKTGTSFRPGARDFLQTLRAKDAVVIISNSRAEAVQTKLTKLMGENHLIAVIGGAKKYELDQSWDKVPELVHLEGFPRPISMRRKYYYNALTTVGLRNIRGVCGDIWELDLSLPEFLGIGTALALSNRTPEWERQHYVNHPNGFASSSLEELAKYLVG